MTLEGEYIYKVLIAVFIACDGSLSAHVPAEKIYSKMRVRSGTAEEKHISTALKILKNKGYIGIHPTSGGETYQMTKMGRDFVITIYKKDKKALDDRLSRYMVFLK